ncbi:MAG: histidinol-phosphate transaminase [Candidatus Nanopelagicales bacterium]
MPGPRLRDALDRLPAYVAGRPPVGHPDLPPYKLSSNENPYPPLPGVLEAVAAGAASTNRYPDPASTALVDALAERYAVPRDHLALGTGSVGLLQQVVQISAGPGDEVLFAWRSFEAYPIMTIIGGATAVQVPLRDDQTHDLDAMADAITERTRLILVCTPNNPTGTVVRQDELDRFLDRVPDDVLVIVDEAYVEFVRDPDAVRGLDTYRDRPNVAVLRTFSKAYGLAGLRVGMAVAHPPVAHALRQTAVPFGVSSVAQAAAIASLAAEDALLERVHALVAERTRVEAALAAQGWVLPPSQANFVWLRTERLDELVLACEQVNLSVRRYADDGIRVTIGETEANDRFLEVSARFA